MARFARLNDSDPRIRGRLQAQLYRNRNKNRNRRKSFSPKDLFISTEGFWFNSSSCFSDLGGLSQCAVNDKIARLNDLSGNQNNFLQSNSVNRPVLGLQNSREVMVFDGIQTFLELSKNFPRPLSVAFKFQANVSHLTTLLGTDEWAVRLAASVGPEFTTFTILDYDFGRPYSISQDICVVLNISDDPYNADLIIDGSQFGSINGNGVSPGSIGIDLGRRTTGTEYFSGKLFEIIAIERQFSSQEISNVSKYLMEI